MHMPTSLVVARSGPADALVFLNPDKAIRSGQFRDTVDLDTVGFYTHTPFCNWRSSHNMPERTSTASFRLIDHEKTGMGKDKLRRLRKTRHSQLFQASYDEVFQRPPAQRFVETKVFGNEIL